MITIVLSKFPLGAVDTRMLSEGLTLGYAGDETPDELVNKFGQLVNGTNISIDGGTSIKLSTE